MAKNYKDKKKSTNTEGRGREQNGKETNKTKGSKNPGKGVATPSDARSTFVTNAGKLDFSYAMGATIPMAEPNEALTFTRNDMTIPGIMRLGVTPIPTVGDTFEAPFNEVIRNIFNAIRSSHGSSNIGFERADLGYYIMGAASLVDMHAWIARLVGLTRTAKPNNLYTPRCLVEAAGGNYESLTRHREELIELANTIASRLATVAIPNLEYFTRRYALYGNVFKDYDGPNASYYVFSPDSFWAYKLATTPEETGMFTVPAPDGNIDALWGFAQNMIDNFVGADPFLGHISGAILNAYGENIWKPFLVDDGFSIDPIWDVPTLHCIHNATIIPNGVAEAQKMVKDWKVTEIMDEGSNQLHAMKFLPTIGYTGAAITSAQLRDDMMIYSAGSQIFDAITDNVDPGDAIAFNRFKFATEVTPGPNGQPLFTIKYAGTELITSCIIYYDVSLPGTPVHYGTLNDVYAFDFAPYFVTYLRNVPDGGKLTAVNGPKVYGTYNCFAMVTREQLRRMQRVSVMSALGQLG